MLTFTQEVKMKTISITWKNSQKRYAPLQLFLRRYFCRIEFGWDDYQRCSCCASYSRRRQPTYKREVVAVVLQLPAADVLGFEYAPSTTSEKKRYEETWFFGALTTFYPKQYV